MLYRKQSGILNRWLIVGTSLLTLIVGLLAGRLSAPQATLASLLAPDQQFLRQASGALDIAALEYARARQGSAQSQTAALNAVKEARRQLEQSTDVQQLFPEQARQAKEALGMLSQAVQRRAAVNEVNQLLARARTALGQVTPRF